MVIQMRGCGLGILWDSHHHHLHAEPHAHTAHLSTSPTVAFASNGPNISTFPIITPVFLLDHSNLTTVSPASYPASNSPYVPTPNIWPIFTWGTALLKGLWGSPKKQNLLSLALKTSTCWLQLHCLITYCSLCTTSKCARWALPLLTSLSLLLSQEAFPS